MLHAASNVRAGYKDSFNARMIEIGRWPYIGRSLAGKRRADRAVKVQLFAKGQYLSCEQLQHRRI